MPLLGRAMPWSPGGPELRTHSIFGASHPAKGGGRCPSTIWAVTSLNCDSYGTAYKLPHTGRGGGFSKFSRGPASQIGGRLIDRRKSDRVLNAKFLATNSRFAFVDNL